MAAIFWDIFEQSNCLAVCFCRMIGWLCHPLRRYIVCVFVFAWRSLSKGDGEVSLDVFFSPQYVFNWDEDNEFEGFEQCGNKSQFLCVYLCRKFHADFYLIQEQEKGASWTKIYKRDRNPMRSFLHHTSKYHRPLIIHKSRYFNTLINSLSFFQSLNQTIMKPSYISSLLLAVSLASAATIPSPLLRRELSENDIIVWGKSGRAEVMDKAEYKKLSSTTSEAFDITSSTPATLTKKDPASKIERRCSKETVYTIDKTESFLGWDVPMSSVIHATGETNTISVTAGYSISNSVSVSAGASIDVIENFLSATFSVSYSETWTSSYTAGYTFSVPEGKYAAIVSNPSTTRRSGHVDIGCAGQAGESYTFVADSFTSKAYDSLAWVDGTISLCTGDTYPLQRCIGSGSL